MTRSTRQTLAARTSSSTERFRERRYSRRASIATQSLACGAMKAPRPSAPTVETEAETVRTRSRSAAASGPRLPFERSQQIRNPDLHPGVARSHDAVQVVWIEKNRVTHRHAVPLF